MTQRHEKQSTFKESRWAFQVVFRHSNLLFSVFPNIWKHEWYNILILMHVDSETMPCPQASKVNHSNISLFQKRRFPTRNCSPWPIRILLAFTRTFQIQHPCQPYQMTSQQDEKDEIAPKKYFVMFNCMAKRIQAPQPVSTTRPETEPNFAYDSLKH